jgi:hypothetical protein
VTGGGYEKEEEREEEEEPGGKGGERGGGWARSGGGGLLRVREGAETAVGVGRLQVVLEAGVFREVRLQVEP